MNKISLNDLNVDNNKFFFNINDTFIEFRITAIENDLCITLRIDSSDEELTFYSMEDVLMFVQKIIKEKKESKNSIISYYNELNNQGELKQKVTVTKTNGAFLTKDNIYSAISGYFGQGKNYKVSATSEVYDGTEGKEIFFYLVEHLDYDGIKKDVKTGLTNQDLKNAINYYLSETNFVFVDLKDGRKLAYRHLDNNVTYEGLNIIVAEKEKEQKEAPMKIIKQRKPKKNKSQD